MDCKNKYIKYKEKYINLKKIIGGKKKINNLIWHIINENEYIIIYLERIL